LVVGLAAGVGLIVWRVAAAGTLLAVSGFDAMVLIAWLIGLEVFVVRGAGRLRGVDVFLLPVATLLQLASLLMVRSGTGGASHMNQWHIIGHAMVITLSGAFFVASGVAGVIYLIVHRAMRTKKELSILGRLPPLESLERFGRVMVAFGFPLLTFGILTGVCGIAHLPEHHRSREMMMASGTLVLWAAYGVAMVVVWLKPRLRGPRAAALATGAAGLTVLNFVAYLLMRSQV
jgi:ABC-type uncharacterized transport system permease subunit